MTENHLPNWLTERTILLGPTGSVAYGTDTPESDQDFKGICIPPRSYYLGLDAFNEYNNTGGKNYTNTKDDVDVNILHLTKFVKEAMAGAPGSLELLFLRPEDYVTVTPLGQTLLDHRSLFLTKQIERKFGGYAYGQLQRLKLGKGREELIEQFGYDTKSYMHAVRLLTSAIRLFEMGTYSTYHPDHDFLTKLRYGLHDSEQAIKHVDYLNRQLKDVVTTTKLPEKPDYNQVNDLLMKLTESGIQSDGSLANASVAKKQTPPSKSVLLVDKQGHTLAQAPVPKKQEKPSDRPKWMNEKRERQLYVLRLEGDNYYVGTSQDAEKQIHKHFNGQGSRWATVHKPVAVISTETLKADTYDASHKIENLKTLELMKEKGWEKVRGGYFNLTNEVQHEKVLMAHKRKKTFGKAMNFLHSL